MGLKVDDQGRIVLGGVAVDVTPSGLATVRAVLKRNWEELTPSALELVRKHFEADPSQIPGPEEVDHRLLASTGGMCSTAVRARERRGAP